MSVIDSRLSSVLCSSRPPNLLFHPYFIYRFFWTLCSTHCGIVFPARLFLDFCSFYILSSECGWNFKYIRRGCLTWCFLDMLIKNNLLFQSKVIMISFELEGAKINLVDSYYCGSYTVINDALGTNAFKKMLYAKSHCLNSTFTRKHLQLGKLYCLNSKLLLSTSMPITVVNTIL